MCHHCHPLGPHRETRRSFLGKLTAGLAVSAGMFCTGRALAQLAAPRGSRTGWARLITPGTFWGMHSEQDPVVAGFIRRETGLNLDTASYSVDPAKLEELSTFPFIFTNDLTAVVDPQQLDNIREYLQRGGFFYIEGCLDHRVTRGFGEYLTRHAALFLKLLPGTELRRLAPNHAIFHAYFPVNEGKLALIPPTVDEERWKGASQALYGVYQQGRMVSLISLDHLQCEWVTKLEKIPACMEQIANIYIYAMTR